MDEVKCKIIFLNDSVGYYFSDIEFIECTENCHEVMGSCAMNHMNRK